MTQANKYHYSTTMAAKLCNAVYSITSSSSNVSIKNLASGGTTGGLVGISNCIGINKCYSKADIYSLSSGDIGGLIGYTTESSNILESYSMGNIEIGGDKVERCVGGLIGKIMTKEAIATSTGFLKLDIILYNANISNCYSEVDIKGSEMGTSNIGGLVGSATGFSSYKQLRDVAADRDYIYYFYCPITIENTYAIGKISVTDGNKKGLLAQSVGNLVTLKNSYWSPETTGLSAGETGEGTSARSAQEMIYSNNYTNWDFDTIWAIESDGGSFPFLKEVSGLAITKRIEDTEIPIKDAKIGIYNKYGIILKGITGKDRIGTTDKDGKAYFTTTNMEPGEYYYQEVEAPTGYKLNSTTYPFVVDNSGKVTYGEGSNGVIYDEPTSSAGVVSVEIKKYETGTTNPVQGAKIALCTQTGSILKDKEGTNDAVLTTGADGKINFATIYNFTKGTYYYMEVQAPEGYTRYTGIDSFTVDESGNITFNNGTNGIIYNEKIITTIPAGSEGATLTKQDETTKAVLAGAQIGLYDEAKTSLSIVLTTNASGQVDLSEKGNLEKGKTYYYKEEVAPAGYIQDTNFHKFTVTTDGKVVIEDGNVLTNKKRTAGENQGIVTKYKSVKGVGTIVVVSGAKIGLYEADGTTKIAELVTDDKGQVSLGSTGKLEAGKTYKYKEETAPDGYILNNTVYEIEVKADGTVEFKQEPKGIIYNEERLFLNSSVYEIDTKYMTRIKPRTTVAQLKANCTTNGDIEIYKGDKKLEDTDIVGTGMILKDTKLDEKIELKLSVIGDLNGDGKVTLTDIARSELAYIGNIDLQEEYLLSADINNDKKHTLTDISRLEQYLVGLIEI